MRREVERLRTDCVKVAGWPKLRVTSSSYRLEYHRKCLIAEYAAEIKLANANCIN